MENRWIAVAAAVLMAALSSAVGEVPPAGEEPVVEDAVETPRLPFLRAFHNRMSGRVMNSVDRLDQILDRWLLTAEQERSQTFDQFFGDRRIDDARRRSYISLATEIEYREGGGIDPGVAFDAVIDLPRTERSVQLVIRNVRDADTTLVDILSRRDALTADEERNRSAALRILLLEESKFSVDFDAGMSFDPEPDPEFKLRGIYGFPMGDWRGSISQSVFWEWTDGVGEKSQIAFRRPLGGATWFRAATAAVWSETTDGVEMGQSFVLHHSLDSRRSVALKAAAQTASDPEWIWRRYLLRLKFSRMIHDDWVFLEIEPGADFPESRGYDFVPLISFALEFRFGDTRRIDLRRRMQRNPA